MNHPTEMCKNLTPEQLDPDPVEVFDLSQMDADIRAAWLTYCAMRRCLDYFVYLHIEIEPFVRAIEGSSTLRRPESDLMPSFHDEES